MRVTFDLLAARIGFESRFGAGVLFGRMKFTHIYESAAYQGAGASGNLHLFKGSADQVRDAAVGWLLAKTRN